MWPVRQEAEKNRQLIQKSEVGEKIAVFCETSSCAFNEKTPDGK
jgi:hypothetical protein